MPRSNLVTVVHFAIILLIGLLPLTWYSQNFILAKGDSFPFWFDPTRTLWADIHTWSPWNLGAPNNFGSYVLYELVWLLLSSVGLTVGATQTVLQIFLSVGSGLFMYALVRTLYPELELAPLVSGVFYMFNFFVLEIVIQSVGIWWTYTFMPLLITLLLRVVKGSTQDEPSALWKSIFWFALMSSVAFSFSSQNPANIVLPVLVLGITLFYYAFLEKRSVGRLSVVTAKLASITALFNLWWIIPQINYYITSPLVFREQIDVVAWSWTHGRASLLNLFWLNGFWGWRPEYYPFYDTYSNPVLTFLTFVPFLLAAIALLFKTKKSLLNAYLMLAIGLFLFLAKGLHEPMSALNLVLYAHLPGMSMFREPASKFMMASLPLVAILIGYSVHHIANAKVGRHQPTRLTRIIVVGFFISVLAATAYPLVTNPIETKTPQLPFSTYVRIPDYYYEASNWLNNQPEGYRILITPPDDFYQMPYTWGYYGAEFWTRLTQKPVLLGLDSYKISSGAMTTLQQLYDSLRFNRTSEFKVFLDLLSVKYIVQRNDIMWNLTGRSIISSSIMQAFLVQQPYIHLIRKFGQLDVYEYTEIKPYVYVLHPSALQHLAVDVEQLSQLEKSWSFADSNDVQDWQNATNPSQWKINYTINQDEGMLRAELWNSTWGWKTISSPLLPTEYGGMYDVNTDIKGQNAYQVHVKMAEYNENRKILAANYMAFVNDGTFNWTHTTFHFQSTNKTTKYLQIQIWHGHETDKPFPNIIWVDNVKIDGHITRLNITGLELIFNNSGQNQPATILHYAKPKPTEITATVDATEPFVLAVSEALDESWTAYVNGRQYKPIPLYLGLKGFSIDQTGLLEVTIEYEPQRWFFYGSIISATTFLACITYLTYSYTKNKPILKRIKTILRPNKSETM